MKLPKISPTFRLNARWAIFHVALVIFACDLLAAVWPAFDHVWQAVARIGVASGVIMAAAFEYLEHREEERERQRLLNFHKSLRPVVKKRRGQ